MAANDAYQLQGRNGVALVGTGQTFAGESVSFLVAEEASLEATLIDPRGDEVILTLTAAPVGFYPGGKCTGVIVTTGQVLVYPQNDDYTIA